jgi:hypothetical protein
MKTDFVKAIFTNVLFVIGVILLIVGFTMGTNTAVKSIVFDKYPLDIWEETRCNELEQYGWAMAERPVGEPGSSTELTEDQQAKEKAEKEERVEKCVAAQTQQRQRKQVEDIVSAFTMLVAGSVLVFTFRGFIFSSKKA